MMRLWPHSADAELNQVYAPRICVAWRSGYAPDSMRVVTLLESTSHRPKKRCVYVFDEARHEEEIQLHGRYARIL